LIGGIALILGIGTRIIGTLFSVIMIGALISYKLTLDFLGGYELDLALLAMSIFFIFANRSHFSLDNQIFNKEGK